MVTMCLKSVFTVLFFVIVRVETFTDCNNVYFYNGPNLLEVVSKNNTKSIRVEEQVNIELEYYCEYIWCHHDNYPEQRLIFNWDYQRKTNRAILKSSYSTEGLWRCTVGLGEEDVINFHINVLYYFHIEVSSAKTGLRQYKRTGTITYKYRNGDVLTVYCSVFGNHALDLQWWYASGGPRKHESKVKTVTPQVIVINTKSLNNGDIYQCRFKHFNMMKEIKIKFILEDAPVLKINGEELQLIFQQTNKYLYEYNSDKEMNITCNGTGILTLYSSNNCITQQGIQDHASNDAIIITGIPTNILSNTDDITCVMKTDDGSEMNTSVILRPKPATSSKSNNTTLYIIAGVEALIIIIMLNILIIMKVVFPYCQRQKPDCEDQSLTCESAKTVMPTTSQDVKMKYKYRNPNNESFALSCVQIAENLKEMNRQSTECDQLNQRDDVPNVIYTDLFLPQGGDTIPPRSGSAYAAIMHPGRPNQDTYANIFANQTYTNLQ